MKENKIIVPIWSILFGVTSTDLIEDVEQDINNDCIVTANDED